MRKPRRSYRRPLTRFEALEGRRMLATDLGQITGVVTNDLDNGPGADVMAPNQVVELFLDNPGAGTVGVFDASDLSQGTRVTDAAGEYSFDNLVEGDYFVRVNPIAGTQTRPGENVSPLISFSAADAMGTTNITIDDFTASQDITATRTAGTAAGTSVSNSGFVDDGSIEGGEQDMFVEVTDGVGDVRGRSGFDNGTATVLSLSSDPGVNGRLIVSYDGDDDDGANLVQGFGGDLLQGGTNSGFALNIATDQVDGTLILRAYNGAVNVSTATIELDNLDGGADNGAADDVDTDGTIDGDPQEQITVNFSDFVMTSGGGVGDFSSVTALEVELDFTGAGENGLDAQIEMVGVVGFTTRTADFTVLNEMSLGDRVWIDSDNDGMLMGGEAGVNGVALTLFHDIDNDDILDPGETTPVATTTTSNLGGLDGSYLFTGLLPDDYLVRVDASNFAAGQPLAGLSTSTGNDVAGMAPDADADTDNDKDRGTAQGDGSVLSKAVTLVGNDEPTDDGDADNNTDRTIDFGFFGYDLSIDKTVNLPTAAVGDGLTYTIMVTNQGPSDATGVTLTDTLPNNVTFVSGSAGVVGAAGNPTVTANIGNLGAGLSTTITINVTIDNDAVGVLTNSATVSGVDETDVLPNTDTAQTTVTPRIDVDITKVDNDNNQTLAPGDTVTYTLVAGNNGPSQATGVVVTDVLPTGMTFVAAGSTPPSSTTAVAGGTQLTYNLGAINAGDANDVTITINATINAGVNGTLINNASIAANETETIPVANNSASAQSVVAIPLGALNGKVYVDIDGDNNLEAEDQPIAGVLITLFDDQNNPIATTTTDASGCYEFTGLMPGVYRVVQTQPSGFPDLDETSGDPGADVTGDNQIANITVVGNQTTPANDFTEGLPNIGKRSFFWSRLFGLNNTNV